VTVSAGSRLGPYEVIAPLGAGGMGEVWRARDTRLDRSVAIKVLSTNFAGQADLRARFDREARTISQLNHPNICALYDVGHEDGTSFLVMELLDGESLADRITRGPLPLSEVLKYGAQIAEALDKAHRAGIVHRDLKPANIMLTKGGAKLLDFGLAKAHPTINLDIDGATEHKPLTREGTILGTFQYMAPEQLEAEEADARTDIFSLGAVLYEMATGRRAFEGKTKTSLIAAIVGGTPRPISELQPLTPSMLDHVIARCMAKEPDERWQSAGDVAGELRWISSRDTGSGIAEGPVLRSPPWRMPWIVAAIAVIAAVSLALFAQRLTARLAMAERPLRMQLMMPPELSVTEVVNGPLTLSPDGSRLAFVVGSRNDLGPIAVRDLRTGETKALAGTAGALFPFWSPDSRSLGFFADGKLSTMPVAGGPIQRLCDAPEGRGGSWSRQGVIVFTPDITQPIFKVSEAGGTPVVVTKNRTGTSHRNPLVLPDGKVFLYTAHDGEGKAVVAAASIEGDVDRQILDTASNVQYADGHLFFVRDRNLFVQRFDPDSLTLSGAPVAAVENIEFYESRNAGNFSVSNNGVLAYRTSSPNPSQFFWFDRQGRNLGPAGPAGAYLSGSLSRDGRKLAAIVGNTSAADVWIIQPDRGTITRATFTNRPILSAVLSPDGDRVAVTGGGTGRNSAWIQELSGRALRTELFKKSSEWPTFSDWSPDGEHLITILQRDTTRTDVVAVPVRNAQKLLPLLGAVFTEGAPSVSPDGKWLAYQSDESGRPQIYVTSFPASEEKWQISNDRGSAPRWAAAGNELFFVNGGRLFAAAKSASGEFATPVALPLPVMATPNNRTYDVAPDGRFIILTEAGQAAPNPVQLILNWQRELVPRD